MNVIPTVILKKASQDLLLTDIGKGCLLVKRYSVETPKELQNIILEALSMYQHEGEKYLLKSVGNNSSQTSKEYNTLEALMEEVHKKLSTKKLIIQPFLDTTKFIRGFHCPPKTKLFNCQIESSNINQEDPDVTVVNQIQDGILSVVENQCKNLFNSFQSELFALRNQKLLGMTFDFVEHQST